MERSGDRARSFLQYPQTGRTLCNPKMVALAPRSRYLAVPSDGSNPMQQRRLAVLLYVRYTCSTLRRVEPYATSPLFLCTMPSTELQYPQKGRTLCKPQIVLNAMYQLWIAIPSDW